MIMIGVQTGGLSQLYGVDGAYKAIKEAGYDLLALFTREELVRLGRA